MKADTHALEAMARALSEILLELKAIRAELQARPAIVGNSERAQARPGRH